MNKVKLKTNTGNFFNPCSPFQEVLFIENDFNIKTVLLSRITIIVEPLK